MLTGQILVVDENGKSILKLEDIEELEKYLIHVRGNDSEPIELHLLPSGHNKNQPYRKFIIYQ